MPFHKGPKRTADSDRSREQPRHYPSNRSDERSNERTRGRSSDLPRDRAPERQPARATERQPVRTPERQPERAQEPRLRQDERREESAVVEGQYVVGRRAALELLHDEGARARIEKLYVVYGVQGPQIQEILHLARKHRIALGELDRVKFRDLERRASRDTETQGVIVLLAQRGYQELEDVLTFDMPPLLIALDGVEDPHNIGAVIRSAEAAGADGILLPRRGAVLTPAVYKTSAGAANNLAIVKYGNLEQTIRLMQEEYGVPCFGLAGEADETIYDVDLTGPVCFVTGSEEKGLHRLVRERCEKLLRIPLAGKTASLNASVASAVALFEAVRQRAALSGRPPADALHSSKRNDRQHHGRKQSGPISSESDLSEGAELQTPNDA